MKNIIPLVFAISYSVALPAQGVFQNQTNGILEKVIQDYPNQFKNIKGDLLVSSAQVIEYKSVVSIPGAIAATVTQYDSNNKKLMSWQSTVFSSTEFEDARTKFKEIFGQIKNTIVKIEGERPVILNGQYETPAEQKNTTILFDLLPATASTKEMKVGLVLEKIQTEWKIVLSVYDKDRHATEPLAAN